VLPSPASEEDERVIAWFVAGAWAGALGPWEQVELAEDDNGAPPQACTQQFPYALVQLPDNPSLYRRHDPTRSWGAPDFVEAIVEATAQVALDYPDSDPVLVGDLSLRQGGPLPPHRFHGDGRSADLGLFTTGGRQPPVGFLPVDPADLDVERQWALIEAFLVTGRVEHVLLDQKLVDRLEGWLRETGRLSEGEIARIFPSADAPRLWELRGIVRAAVRHKDHMHVRFVCE
jgi:hypothetical protein